MQSQCTSADVIVPGAFLFGAAQSHLPSMVRLLAFLALLGPAWSSGDWLQSLKDLKLPGEEMLSAGCASLRGARAWGGREGEGFEGWVPLTIMDFTPVNRSFYVQLPKGVGTSRWRPAPLLIALHSQGDQADSMAYNHDYGTFGKSLGFVSACLR